jgi:uncharacterized cofD-like protein
MRVPPPGDIRNVLAALADTEPLIERVLQYRFTNGEGLAGHALGNLLLAALTELTGDFHTAVKELSRVLAVRGQVLPASRENILLVAEMTDGSVVYGEANIAKSNKRIGRLSLRPARPKPLMEVLAALRSAEMVVVGPGSLYTSLLPNLLVDGVADVLRASMATKIYVCNIMTQPGETTGYTASQHVRAIYRHVPDLRFDIVIVNTGLSKKVAKEQICQRQLVALDIKELSQLCCRVLAEDLVSPEHPLRHDADKLGELIFGLVKKTKKGRLYPSKAL